MKLKKQKYLFIAILAFLVTSCGSSGGSSSQNSTIPPTSNDTVKPDNGNNGPQNENNKPSPDENKPDNNKPHPPDLDENKPDGNNPPPENNKPDNENPNPDGDNGENPPNPDDGKPPEDNKPDNGNPPPEDNKPDNSNPGDITINNPNSQGLVTNNQNVTNEGTITTNQPVDSILNVIPILAKDSFTGTNNGLIIGTNSSNNKIMYGMMGINDGNIVNTGNINLTGHNVIGMSIEGATIKNSNIFATNSGNIDLKISSDFKNSMLNENSSIHLIGMEANANSSSGSYTLNNKGVIKVDSSKYIHGANTHDFRSFGMSLITSKENKNSHSITNNGTITTLGEKSIGMLAIGENISAINNKEISVTGIGVAGMKVTGKNSTATNMKNITVKGDTSIGINAVEIGTGINDSHGIINIDGKEASGMKADGEFAKVINKGTINVAGENAAGIRASNDGKGVNETTGTITVGDSAYGMYADSGGTIENKGKIILAGSTTESTGMYSIGQNSLIINSGDIMMKNEIEGTLAINAEGGKYINSGKIFGKDNVEITGDKLGQFVVGTKADGNVGVVVSRKIKINGNVVADKNLIKSNKKKVLYKNVFVAPTIELAKENNEQPVSLFYNSDLKKNSLGNVDMEVYRNKNTVEKIYKSKSFNSLISELDKFLNTENSILSKDETLVTNKILKSNDTFEVRKTVKDLSGEIYSNLTRQIFDIQDRFVKEDIKLIDNLDEYDYNFNFFGDKTSVKNKGEISGYKSTSGGFVGTKKFQDNLYATIGYENSNIKYSEGSKGSIQSIHTGFYKKLSLNEFNIDLGLNGEYNFHETNREIDSFSVKAKGKYNSYSLGANGEISRVYGESLYFKPSVELSLGYGQYEKFTEKNAGDLGLIVKDESYFSIVPKVGFKVGKNFEFIDIYSNVIYSYELGDLNKKQGMSLLGDKVHYTLNSDSLEKINLTANIGISTEIKDFKIALEVGKEFGKRENNYLALGVGYRF